MIRNIIRTRIYDSYYDDGWYYPSYASYYYGTAYEPIYGSPLVINFAYYGIANRYYDPYPSYVSYVPLYGRTYYDPYYSGYGYYYEDIYPSYVSYDYYPTYSSAGYYGYDYDDYGYDPYVNVVGGLPVGDLVYEVSGNSFLSQLLSSFLSQGYEQGYQDGLYARDAGYYDEEYYYDPYAYHETAYDTYSVNLAENRRIFSEGYEAGYRDAMMAQADEDYVLYEESQPDLVGLLVGDVLSGV